MTPRQKEIVNAAISIIAQEGFQELTTKHLAAKIGFSEAALYRHFESKTQLVHMILEYFQEIAMQTMDDIQKNIKSPLKQVKAFIINRFHLFIDNPDLAKVMFSEDLFLNDSSLAEHHLQIMHIHKEQLIKSIKKGQKQDMIRKDIRPIFLFRIVIGSIRLLITQWNLSKQSFDLLKEGRKLWQAIEKIIKEKK